MNRGKRADQRFPARRRLNRDILVRAVLARGKKWVLPQWHVYGLPRGGPMRLALRTPKQAGQAVYRQLLRRLAREFFRRHQAEFYGYDIVAVARWQKKGAVPVARKEMVGSWQLLLKKWPMPSSH